MLHVFHCGSFDPVGPAVHFVRNIGICVRLDAILHHWTHTHGSLWWVSLEACLVTIWYCAKISTGPNLVRPLRKQTSRNLWNRSVLESNSMLTTSSSTIHASRHAAEIQQPVPCASLSLWGLDVMEPAQTDCWQDTVNLLYGLSGYLLNQLQFVMNSAARLIQGVFKFNSVSVLHPQWTSLAADPESYPVQDRSSCTALYRWCGTRVLDRTLSSGEFFLWLAESMLRLRWWSCYYYY